MYKRIQEIIYNHVLNKAMFVSPVPFTHTKFFEYSSYCEDETGFHLSGLWMKSKSMALEMRAIKKHSPVVLFIMLYKVVLTFDSIDEILKCDHCNESY